MSQPRLPAEPHPLRHAAAWGRAWPRPFTNRGLAEAAGLSPTLAARMTYCLRAVDGLAVVGRGKHGARLFAEA